MSMLTKASLASTKKINQIKAEEKQIIDQIKIEKGGVIQFEQLISKTQKYNGEDPYTIKFLCTKKPQSRAEASCKVVEYQIFNNNE